MCGVLSNGSLLTSTIHFVCVCVCVAERSPAENIRQPFEYCEQKQTKEISKILGWSGESWQRVKVTSKERKKIMAEFIHSFFLEAVPKFLFFQ